MPVLMYLTKVCPFYDILYQKKVEQREEEMADITGYTNRDLVEDDFPNLWRSKTSGRIIKRAESGSTLSEKTRRQ